MKKKVHKENQEKKEQKDWEENQENAVLQKKGNIFPEVRKEKNQYCEMHEWDHCKTEKRPVTIVRKVSIKWLESVESELEGKKMKTVCIFKTIKTEKSSRKRWPVT